MYVVFISNGIQHVSYRRWSTAIDIGIIIIIITTIFTHSLSSSMKCACVCVCVCMYICDSACSLAYLGVNAAATPSSSSLVHSPFLVQKHTRLVRSSGGFFQCSACDRIGLSYQWCHYYSIWPQWQPFSSLSLPLAMYEKRTTTAAAAIHRSFSLSLLHSSFLYHSLCCPVSLLAQLERQPHRRFITIPSAATRLHPRLQARINSTFA